MYRTIVIGTYNDPAVILADVVSANYPAVLLCGADPEKAMCIIMTVTVLEYAIGTAQVRIVHAPIVCFAPVQIAFIELEHGAITASGKHRITMAARGIYRLSGHCRFT